MAFRHDLSKVGRVYVPYPAPIRAAIADTMDLWQRFCELPDEIKLQFPYEADKNQSGNGYELKNVPGETLDRKENFHLRSSAWHELLGVARTIGNKAVHNFVIAGLTLPDIIMPMVIEFARQIQQTYDIPGFEKAVRLSQSELLIRFLHYFGDGEPGDVIASPHIDKGGFTLHLFESAGGVEYLSLKDRTWTPLPVSHDETVFFSSLGLQQRLQNQVRALCYRVVATNETGRHGRFSAVCFVDFKSNVHYNKKLHGRLQDKPVGFNYNLTRKGLQSLFKLSEN